MQWLLAGTAQVAVSDSQGRQAFLQHPPRTRCLAARRFTGPRHGGAGNCGAWIGAAQRGGPAAAQQVTSGSRVGRVSGPGEIPTMAATCEGVSRYSRPHRLCAYPLRLIIQRSAQGDLPGKYRWHASARVSRLRRRPHCLLLAISGGLVAPASAATSLRSPSIARGVRPGKTARRLRRWKLSGGSPRRAENAHRCRNLRALRPRLPQSRWPAAGRPSGG